MSYPFPWTPKYFKEKFEWENQIKDQESQIRRALNYGTLRDIANTVKTLELMVTKSMIPKEDSFEKDMQELKDTLEDYWVKKEEIYRVKKAGSICPGLYKKPSRKIAPRWFYEAKFQTLCNFFARLGLGLQHEQSGHF